jgi:hypothetical protein
VEIHDISRTEYQQMWESGAQTGLSLLYVSQFHDPTFEVLTSSETYITFRTNYTIPSKKKHQADFPIASTHTGKRENELHSMKSNPTNTEPSKFTSREASFFQSPSKMHTKLLPAFSDGPHPSVKVFGKNQLLRKFGTLLSSIIVRADLVTRNIRP